MNNLGDELRRISNESVTTSPQLTEAYNRVVIDMKAQALKGERSCVMRTYGLCLSGQPLKALKAKLTLEGIEIIEHPGYDQRDLAWTELKW
jgi:hypothetical protein